MTARGRQCRARRTRRALELGAIDRRHRLRYLPVGNSRDNVGITAFAVRRYSANQTAYEVLVEVQSFRAQPSTVTLELVQDGEVVEVAEARRSPPASACSGSIPTSPATARGSKARLADDRTTRCRSTTSPTRCCRRSASRRSLLVTAGDLFLEGALLLDENLDVDKIAPATWDAAASAKYDAVVLDGFTPATPPRTNALYLDPHGRREPVRAARQRRRAARDRDGGDASAHALGGAQRSEHRARLDVRARARRRGGGVGVQAADPRRARSRRAARPWRSASTLRRSDLPLRVAFPVLLVNALDWFAGADTGLVASYATGRPWRVPAPAGATELYVKAPDGTRTRAPVHDGRASYVAMHAGFYELESAGAPNRVVAANLASVDRVEHRAAPHARGRRPRAGRARGRTASACDASCGRYFVVLALLLAFVEWWTYNRRVTV